MHRQPTRKVSVSKYLLIILITFIVCVFGCTSTSKVAPHSVNISNLDALSAKITSLISDPRLFNAQVGVYIESVDYGETIYSQNEHKLFISASNMKIFTTATALLRFGPDFRYKTAVFTNSTIKGGVLEGDLIVRGKGDPTIAPRFSGGDPLTFFRSWADSLIDKGITVINGDIVGDESYFQTDRLGYGWQWDDEPFWYSAQISALSFNDNCIDVTVTSNKNSGEPPLVTLSPPTKYFTIENQALTVDPDSTRTLFLTRPRMQNVLLVQNHIPRNKPKYLESISVDDPARYFVFVLKEVLEEKGIEVRGTIKTNRQKGYYQYDQLSRLFTHQSPPMTEIIKVVNKRSQNLYAEQLLITLAAEYGTEATADEGVQVVNSTLSAMGISTGEFLMHDGSGLSRVNLISPYSVGLLLRYMSKSDYFPYFHDSLPIGGVDGSLRRRMVETPAQGRVNAKTGYVGHVRNLSGYATSLDEETFIFSILVNNYLIPTSAINLLQDRICIVLANFSRSQSVR